MHTGVKPSATWQTKSDAPGAKPSSGVFDICARTGLWTNGSATWVPGTVQPALIYIFAWHQVTEPEKVDHRDLSKWLFYVVSSAELPAEQKTISRSVAAQRWPAKKIIELRSAVLRSVASISSTGE